MIQEETCLFDDRLIAEEALRFSHGTLILTCGCRDGLLIAADRRFLRDGGVASDNHRKLFPIDDNIVLATTGTTCCSVSGGNGQENTLFDLCALITNAIVRRGNLEISGFLQVLSDVISSALRPIGRVVAERSLQTAEPLFQILSFAMNENQVLIHGLIEPVARRLPKTNQFEVKAKLVCPSLQSVPAVQNR